MVSVLLNEKLTPINKLTIPQFVYYACTKARIHMVMHMTRHMTAPPTVANERREKVATVYAHKLATALLLLATLLLKELF